MIRGRNGHHPTCSYGGPGDDCSCHDYECTCSGARFDDAPCPAHGPDAPPARSWRTVGERATAEAPHAADPTDDCEYGCPYPGAACTHFDLDGTVRAPASAADAPPPGGWPPHREDCTCATCMGGPRPASASPRYTREMQYLLERAVDATPGLAQAIDAHREDALDKLRRASASPAKRMHTDPTDWLPCKDRLRHHLDCGLFSGVACSCVPREMNPGATPLNAPVSSDAPPLEERPDYIAGYRAGFDAEGVRATGSGPTPESIEEIYQRGRRDERRATSAAQPVDADDVLEACMRQLDEVCTWLHEIGEEDAAKVLHEKRDRWLLPLAKAAVAADCAPATRDVVHDVAQVAHDAARGRAFIGEPGPRQATASPKACVDRAQRLLDEILDWDLTKKRGCDRATEVIERAFADVRRETVEAVTLTPERATAAQERLEAKGILLGTAERATHTKGKEQ